MTHSPMTLPGVHDDGGRALVPSVTIFRSAGAALVVAFRDDGLPEVLHWGSDPGPVDAASLAALDAAAARQVSASALDEPWPLTILPTERDGWQGRPGIAGAIGGVPLLPSWRVAAVEIDDRGFSLRAEADGVRLQSSLRFDEAGVLLVSHTLVNTGDEAIALAALEATLPLAERATELLDFSGRWTRERTPQRRPIGMGSHSRESRRGRTGHDAPLVAVAGTPGFSDRCGEVWAVHLAWSADAIYRTDRLPEGRSVLGAAELLRAGEIVLAPGQSFVTPDAWFIWSDAGLDGLSARVHQTLRARERHPRSDRPVVLNTWEAVYFAHELEPLVALADAAAAVGVERFVLDDGWFLGRRGDDAGLGDWAVDPEVWPEGLHALVDHVRARGMGFGLWVEPEMVNPDSELHRSHPDWLLTPSARSWRNQQVLDVARPDVAAWLLERLDALLTEYPIEYLKWDQNRDLLEAVHAGRPGVDAQTRAVYALLDELRRRHPGVEIESCSSGGARVDLGILARTDRVWASDTNDPIERARIQRWTELLLPPELIGSHVGPARAHTTHRVTDLRFRMATTLFASAGIETDITRFTEEERAELTAWITEYKRLRTLMHTGELMHAETEDEGTALTGVVSADGSHALYRLTREATGEWAVPPALRLPGLDPRRTYRVDVLPALTAARFLDVKPVPWVAAGGVTLPGSLLTTVGVRAPLLAPASALVVEAVAIA
ncbi:alpha-galactosidase [Microbacterium oryzae]|uniref:alpha-galactosidase n=1 Tax=Microbacterium oryzae TaxID=743009 RepID=UPI0025AF4758|nr:alpha-galactosidase [Microbacterium oryzae]MDN3310299.1 alpha-galactosidase [Microbacterium oryzae]